MTMPDLNDFHAFKSTTSGHGTPSGRKRPVNTNQSGDGSGAGCMTVLVVLAILGWFIKIFGG